MRPFVEGAALLVGKGTPTEHHLRVRILKKDRPISKKHVRCTEIWAEFGVLIMKQAERAELSFSHFDQSFLLQNPESRFQPGF